MPPAGPSDQLSVDLVEDCDPDPCELSPELWSVLVVEDVPDPDELSPELWSVLVELVVSDEEPEPRSVLVEPPWPPECVSVGSVVWGGSC